MKRLFPVVLVLMWTLLVGGAPSCMGPDPWPCPTVRVASRPVTDGKVSWSSAGHSGGRALTVPDADPLACAVTVGGGAISRSRGMFRGTFNEWVTIVCGTPKGSIRIDFQLGDSRTWKVGGISVSQEKAALRFQYPSLCGKESCPWCAAYAVAPLAVAVEKVKGGPAGFPSAVTPDYLRVYRVAYKTASPVVGKASATTCGRTVEASFDLRIRVASEHFQPEPDRMCGSYNPPTGHGPERESFEP